MIKILQPTLGAVLLSAALVACGGGISANDSSDDTTTDVDDGGDDVALDEWDQRLTEREVDYNAALRIASLRLVGELPTLAQINQVASAADKKVAYEGLVTQLLADTRFANIMYKWWQDTLKLGADPAYSSAAAFAAKLTVDNGDYRQLLTATGGQCGSFDEATATFTPADCMNGGSQAGLLSHPGMLEQFYSNFAFRRARWVQETFACTKFPAEASDTPIDVGGAALYTGLLPFENLASLTNGGRVDFQDVSAVVCANCHANLNPMSPLFAYYDDKGQNTTAMSVPTPLEGNPPAVISDYLIAGEQVTSWRYGNDTSDLPAFGAAMAADPDIAACAVARAWNWAMGKGDIVDTLQEVPASVIQQQIDDFVSDGFAMKDLLFNVFTSDDFVKF